MKLVPKFEYVCFAAFHFMINVQLVFCQNKNGTIYVKHDSKEHHHHQITEQDQHQKESHHQLQKQPHKDSTTNVPVPDEHYSFVALIEVMFTDGSRRNCTGAIIHDNVVITAAHCFQMAKNNMVQPELSGSFVIIGSKTMFESDNEQYLPIERVLIHPDYKGWTANLAMVYTFTGMVSDKAGNTIPLAHGNSFTSVHSTVTVLNWNQMKKRTTTITTSTISWTGDSCSGSSDELEERYYRKKMLRMTQRIYVSSEDPPAPLPKKAVKQHSTLSMEDYTIIDVLMCKKLALKYRLEFVYENKSICYSLKKSNRIQGNSGALSIHRDHLIAMATGEIISEGEHIIIGTKISCYCTWISENLPSGGTELKCCTNCCDGVQYTEKYY